MVVLTMLSTCTLSLTLEACSLSVSVCLSTPLHLQAEIDLNRAALKITHITHAALSVQPRVIR